MGSPLELQRTDEFHRFVGLALLVLSVGLLVAGVLLLVTCRTATNTVTGTVGCAYPFQADGIDFLYVAFLLAMSGSIVFAGSPSLGPSSKKANVNRWMVFALIALIVGLGLVALATAGKVP